MKKYIIFIIALIAGSSNILQAQNRTLKQVIELKMPKTKADDLCGTRGAGVCWNPVTKKYYAAFAGNVAFPMGVFTAAGKLISSDTLTTMEDIRGIWYDPDIKTIMANGYNEIGWVNYDLDKTGIPINYNYKYTGMNQPNDQSVGTYDSKIKRVLFLDGSRVMQYDGNSGITATITDSVQIHWGRKKAQGAGDNEDAYQENEDYNGNVIASNIKGGEFGFLNIKTKQVELYGYKDGFLLQTLKLPQTAPVESFFNFAYSNGIYWLFDIENRKWIGYK